MTHKIRLLLVDDHAVLRAGLRTLLNAEPDMEVVGEASDGKQAIDRIATLQPDVVLMDITMPEMNGLDATRRIRKLYPDVRVLVLTMHDSEEYLLQTLQAGGSGYVPKKAADTDLITAIRLVHAGENFLYQVAGGRLPQDPAEQTRPDQGTESPDRLTERERQVLKLMAEGYTNQEIAGRLVISVKTVETHRANIMEKLGVRTRAELVRYALSRGMLETGG
ncbi:MAG: response regulator [Sphingomonadaceae bacterium]